MTSISLNLLRFILFSIIKSLLENVPCVLVKIYIYYCCWVEYSLCISFIWSQALFKPNFFLLNFCGDDLAITESEVLKNPINIELLSISPFRYVALIYLGAQFMGKCIYNCCILLMNWPLYHYMIFFVSLPLFLFFFFFFAMWLNHLPPMQETQVRSLEQEDPLEKEMVTHSSILAWRITCTEEPGSPWGCRELDMTERLHSNTSSTKTKERYWEGKQSQLWEIRKIKVSKNKVYFADLNPTFPVQMTLLWFSHPSLPGI